MVKVGKKEQLSDLIAKFRQFPLTARSRSKSARSDSRNIFSGRRTDYQRVGEELNYRKKELQQSLVLGLDDQETSSSDDSETASLHSDASVATRIEFKNSRAQKSDRFINHHSHNFQYLCGYIIIANTVTIAAECQLKLSDVSYESTFVALEYCFISFYIVELIIRVHGDGRNFFIGSLPDFTHDEIFWNWFDISITSISIAEIMYDVCIRGVNPNFGASVFRCFRVLRILRLFRSLQFIKETESVIVSAGKSVIRCGVIVFSIDFLAAVLITNLMEEHSKVDQDIEEMFGNLGRSMYCMFQVMVDGLCAVHWNEQQVAIVITEAVLYRDPKMWLFWVIFVFVGCIAVMTLIPAIFIEVNMRHSEKLREEKKKIRWAKKQAKKQDQLNVLFSRADQDFSDTLTHLEILEVLQDPDVTQELGFTAEDCKQMLFEVNQIFDHFKQQSECDEEIELNRKQFIKAVNRGNDVIISEDVDYLQKNIYHQLFLLRNYFMKFEVLLPENMQTEFAKKKTKETGSTKSQSPNNPRRRSSILGDSFFKRENKENVQTGRSGQSRSPHSRSPHSGYNGRVGNENREFTSSLSQPNFFSHSNLIFPQGNPINPIITGMTPPTLSRQMFSHQASFTPQILKHRSLSPEPVTRSTPFDRHNSYSSDPMQIRPSVVSTPITSSIPLSHTILDPVSQIYSSSTNPTIQSRTPIQKVSSQDSIDRLQDSINSMQSMLDAQNNVVDHHYSFKDNR